MDKNLEVNKWIRRYESVKEDLEFVKEQFFNLQRKYKQVSAKQQHSSTSIYLIEDSIKELQEKIRERVDRSFPISDYETHVPYSNNDKTIKKRWEKILEK